MAIKRIIKLIEKDRERDRKTTTFKLDETINNYIDVIIDSVEFLTGQKLKRSEVLEDMISFCLSSSEPGFQIDQDEYTYHDIISIKDTKIKLIITELLNKIAEQPKVRFDNVKSYYYDDLAGQSTGDDEYDKSSYDDLYVDSNILCDAIIDELGYNLGLIVQTHIYPTKSLPEIYRLSHINSLFESIVENEHIYNIFKENLFEDVSSFKESLKKEIEQLNNIQLHYDLEDDVYATIDALQKKNSELEKTLLEKTRELEQQIENINQSKEIQLDLNKE